MHVGMVGRSTYAQIVCVHVRGSNKTKVNRPFLLLRCVLVSTPNDFEETKRNRLELVCAAFVCIRSCLVCRNEEAENSKKETIKELSYVRTYFHPWR